MKEKIKKYIGKGFLMGLIISVLANLITDQTFGMSNVIVGGILGMGVYYIFNIKS